MDKTFSKFRFATTLIASCALSACSGVKLSPDYERPTFAVPTALITSNADNKTAVELATWWKSLHDPVLDALLQEAQANNQDLALASARVLESQALLDQNSASRYPSVDLTAGASRKRISENTATPVPSNNPLSDNRQLGFGSTYEIDFWGKFSRADESARARLLATQANRATVLTTLYANVAQTYISLLAVDAQVTLAEKILATRLENLKLQQSRFDAGVVGEIDLQVAQGELASMQVTYQQARQSQNNTLASLALLLGRTPAQIMNPVIERAPNFETLYKNHSIAADLPADILNRRPDLQSAEQALIAANADIGLARAAYFPKLSLTANFGRESKSVSDLFSPTSAFWNMLGNLTQPIFRAGAIDAVVAAANARQQQALAQYTQAVQNAFKDVHDALVNVDASRDIASTTSNRIEALRSTLRLANLRYKNGYSSYLEVLNAQRDLAQAELGLIDVQRAQLVAVVALYKAVGGGWRSDSTDSSRDGG